MPHSAVRVSPSGSWYLIGGFGFSVETAERRLPMKSIGWKSHFRFLVFFVGAQPPTKTQPM
jgi:hypothetical protein